MKKKRIPNKEERKIKNLVNLFITNVRRGQIKGRYLIGTEAAAILREIVSITGKEEKSQVLINRIRWIGYLCSEQLPTELVIGNTVRRVLFFIRDEYKRYQKSKKTKEKIHQLSEVSHHVNLSNLLDFGEEKDNFSLPNSVIRSTIFERIKELIEEMKDIFTDINYEATKFIRSKFFFFFFFLHQPTNVFKCC